MKSIDEMSISEIKAELSTARGINEKVGKIQDIVVAIKGQATALEQAIKELSTPTTTTTHKETQAYSGSKSSQWRNEILAILKNKSKNTRDLYNDLLGKGMVRALNVPGGEQDYKTVRQVISGLNKGHKIKSVGTKKRGGRWKLAEKPELIA